MLLVALLISGMSIPLYGQQCALKGRIIDEEIDEGVPYCKVLLLQDGKGIGGRMTDEWGFYCISRIDPGTYDIEVSFGYQKKTVEGIVLSPGEIKRQNIGFRDGFIYGMDPSYCPACNMNSRVIPIYYGSLNDRDSRRVRRGKLLHEKRKKGPCDPSWYCKRDEVKF